ncbi:MAG: DUF2098 domain-containing protein, partial [Methanosarcinales archaeon]|nr:DUF2098 domain-containing protein [Methanosarcinales archaeon]
NEHSISQDAAQDADNVYDIHGNVIDIGSTVRYVNTGTTGKVKELVIIDGVEWALLPASDIKAEMDLMYNVGYLEVVDAKVSKKGHARTMDMKDLAKEDSKGTGVDMSELSAPGGAG